jgi:hypothetical protein
MALLGLVQMLFQETDASAATRISSQSGNWSASTTWGGNPAPVAGDDVIINGGFTVTVDASNAACLSIQLGGSVLNAGAGTLAFNSGTQVAVSGALNVGPFNNNTTPGSLTMASGGTLICQGITVGRLGTWTPGTGTIELTATNTIPSNNSIDFNNLTVSGGTTTLSRTVTISGNLLINPGATLDGGANTTTLGGDWTNNGTFTGNTGTIIFVKNGNATISGTGINNFNLMRVNLGVSISNTLEVTASNFTAPDPFLTITNGTFKMSGTFTFANTFFVGPIYNIDPTGGFWINNPNVTVIGQAAGAVSVRGMLRLSAGTYNVGTGIDNSLNYVTGSSIVIEGGALHIAGQLTRNNATQTTSYTQSGGTVTVVEQGSTNAAFGGFDLGAVGSTFTMSGGTIVVRNATDGPAEYVNASSVASVSGGTLQIGDVNTANAQTIRIQSARPIGNLLISNATSQATKPTAQLITSSLNAVGSVTIQSGTTLNANGLNLSLGGDWSNSGAFTGGNTVTFNGTGGQALTRTGGETFGNLIISKTGGPLTLNSSVIVNNTFSLSQGTIAVGSNTLTLNSTVTGGGTFTSASTGTVSYSQGSAGQSVLAGNYGNLVFSDFNKTLASTGTIGIAGTFTPGSAVGHTVTGSTIDFSGGSQAVPAFAYNNLTLSGGGTKTGSGTLTVGGNMANNTGIVFTGTTILNLNGTTQTNNGTLSTATLSVGSGATLMNNGTMTTSTTLSGAGTLSQGATGILNIGGTAGISALNAFVAGNTVNYTGASQTVIPTTYHHLTLSGSGTPILTGVSTINGNFLISGSVTPIATTGMAIGGNFTISSGTSFDAGSFSHALKGNWSNAGTFNAGTSTFALNGATAQTMSGSTFSNLIINNAAGVSMLSDETVGNTLTLTGGAFSIGAHSLTLNGALSIGGGSLVGGTSSNIVVGGSGASTTLPAITLNNLTLNRASGDSLGGDATINGVLTITNGTLNTGVNAVILGSTGTLTEPAGQPVVGTVRTTRNVTATTGTETFGNIGSDVALNGVALGSTTVSRKTGTASTGSSHSSIKRYFDIIPTTNTGLNAGFVFHYDNTELNAQNANTLELYRSHDNGTTWSNLGGVVNAAARTLTLSGINDFSRWTASDTTNRIGNTATPAITDVVPASKNIGDPAFTITVNGNDFINGKSTVRFNGNNRTTTFVSTTQLTASIPASDLLSVGSFPVTVFNAAGGGLSNPQTFTVVPLPPTKVRVETSADGSGTVVPAQFLTSGSSITVYAITRDTLNNFVANVAATVWTLENITGGVVAGDLVAALDGKSAVFTAHVIGTADIKATSGALATTPSGVITVTPGTSTKVRVETAANGSGTIVPAQTQASGSSITVFAITRDASNNFVANVASTAWSLQNITGGVVAGDLVPSVDTKSAVFTAHVAGSANIRATSGGLPTTSSGTITVTSGVAAAVRVETAADGSGTAVPAQSLASGSSITVFAITRDASNNFVANVAATAWSLQNITGGVVAGDLVPSVDSRSAVFTAHAIGSANIRATSGGLPTTSSGTITVTSGAATAVRVETAADGSGTAVPAQSLASGSSITVFAITRDASNNFLANVAASTWSLQNITGGVAIGDLVPAVDSRSAVFTGHGVGSGNIIATSGGLATTGSGTVTVTPGAATAVRVEMADNGSGTVVPAQSLVSGSSITVFAITRDASNNFVTNIAADAWSLQNVTGGVVAGDLVPAVDSRSAVFTGHAIGSANISATSGALNATSSGAITVTPGTITTNVSIASGWNLISNPVTNPIPGDSVKQLYPTSINSYAFEFSGGYVQIFRLINGKGYWGKFPGATSNAITGTARTRDSITVVAGWNILGTISDTVDTNTIVSVPPGLRVSRWFGYSGGYTAVAQLIPGRGYWVKSSGAGKFVLANPLLGSVAKVQAYGESPEVGLNTLIITDNRGGSQTLYFGVDANDAVPMAMYAMPPIPPAGAFDARFETADGGSMVQTHAPTVSDAVEFSVAVQSDTYPLTVTWKINGGTASYELTDGLGGRLFGTKRMTGEGTLEITNSEVHTFSVKLIGNQQVPEQFVLSQNYPNPFNPSTTIKFGIPRNSFATLKVFNILGQEVATLVNGETEAGSYEMTWNASGLSSGIYLYRLQAGKFIETKQMILLR